MNTKNKLYGWVLPSSKTLLSVVTISFLSLLGSSVTKALRPLYYVEVGSNSIQLGFLMAIPAIISIFTRIPSSAISQNIGRWRMMLFSLTLMTVSNGLFAFVRDPIWFFPIVALEAFSWASFSPLAVELVLDQSTSTTRGSTMGLFFTSIGAAMFVGPLISSVLTLVFNLRQLFLIATIIPFFSLGLFLNILKPSEVKSSETKQNSSERPSVDRILKIFRVSNFVSLSIARLTFAVSMAIFSTIYPVYAKDILGFTTPGISLLFTFRGATNVLIRMPAGGLSDRIGRRKPFLFALILAVIVYASVAFVGSYGPLIVIMSLFGISWGMRIAPSMALVSESVLEKDRALALVLFMTIFDIGAALGSLIAGFSSSFVSQKNLLLYCAPMLLVAALIFTIYSKEVKEF
jgi:MFS family permease